MKKIITIAGILMIVAIPIAIHADSGPPEPVWIYIKGDLEYLGDGWWSVICDGTGDIFCGLPMTSNSCTTPVQDFEGYAYEDDLYYYFYSTQTLPTHYVNDDEGTIIMRFSKAELDAAIEAYCESQ